MSQARIKRHPEELREVAIKRFRSCENVAQLARDIGIPRQTLYRWIDESERVEADEDDQLVPATKGREARLRKRISHLKHVLASKTRQPMKTQACGERIGVELQPRCSRSFESRARTPKGTRTEPEGLRV